MPKLKSLLKILETQKDALVQFDRKLSSISLNSKKFKQRIDKSHYQKKQSWNRTTIKEVLERTQRYKGQEIRVGGWVKTIRQKFIKVSDGSCLKELQLVCSPDLASQLKEIKFGSYLVAKGKLTLTPEREQSCELKILEISFISSPKDDYPLQKQKMTLETIREYPHLRAKTNYFLALFRLRHSISKSIHDFFDQEGFYYVPTPIITSNDTEGAGETFNLTTESKEPFFSKPAQLTVSGQLQAEALAQGLGKVYTFSPCFRAEKSHTTRHLAEFWMVEAEMAPTNFETTLKLTEKLVKFIINSILKKQIEELKFLEKYSGKETVSKLKEVIKKDFIQLEYTRAINILKESKEKFIFSNIKWGMDLKAEHEKYLCSHYREQPIFITDYPRDLKAFYMKDKPNKKTVECFDLIFPKIGELIGGSMRENDYETLKEKAQKAKINTQELAWYLDLRQYGYAPSGGFGLGLERLIMFIGEVENIQDTIAFPLFHKHLKY